MEYIDNIETLNKLIQTYFRKGTATNNYFMANTYANHIENKKLAFVATKDNAALLLEKHDFYQVYFYINNFTEIVPIPEDRPAIIELIYRGETKLPVVITDYWSKQGFQIHLTRDNMSANLQYMDTNFDPEIGIKLKYAELPEELAFIENLFLNAFDKYTGNLLSTSDLTRFINEKNIICALYNGELAGFLQFEVKNRIVWLGHIAVDAKYRGKGIANELVKKYIRDNCNEEINKFQLWVIQNNVSALNLYNKFGFIYGGKTTTSMLRTNC